MHLGFALGTLPTLMVSTAIGMTLMPAFFAVVVSRAKGEKLPLRARVYVSLTLVIAAAWIAFTVVLPMMRVFVLMRQ